MLSFGLKFDLPVHKLSFYKYYLIFGKLINSLKPFQLSSNITFDDVVKSIQSLAHKYYYNFKPFKVFSAIFNKNDVKLLKSLSENKDLVVCKSDKSNNVVLMDRTDYVQKVYNILTDQSKFRKLSHDIYHDTIKIEDKINRFLRKIKDLNIIDSRTFNELFVSGSSPGIMYGLPKTHKRNVPLRPIFAAYNTPSYSISKYLVKILSPFTTNSYTVSNSYAFVDELIKIPDAHEYYMASFDVESLFTNIPLDETVNIALNCLFQHSDSFLGFTRNLFKTFLELAVLNSFFIFDNQLYEKIDGVGMGLPLGPTFANLFMCFNEDSWLQKCPSDFRPVFYRRYVDDTFVLFKHKSHAPRFLEYLNQQHSNIKFTLETEIDNSISFLDIKIQRNDSQFITSVYRKPTFSGLGTSYFSFCPYKFKINSIKTLLNRAYKLCSNF